MIPVPNLDSIAFDALVEEGRALIPRYAPDWTDHNLHDPGITLLDLLAWIVDQQVYRIGAVGDSFRPSPRCSAFDQRPSRRWRLGAAKPPRSRRRESGTRLAVTSRSDFDASRSGRAATKR